MSVACLHTGLMTSLQVTGVKPAANSIGRLSFGCYIGAAEQATAMDVVTAASHVCKAWHSWPRPCLGNLSHINPCDQHSLDTYAEENGICP